VVHQEVPPDARRAAYACDIAYCTNKEMVFDYLRDRVAAGGRASAVQLRARRLFGATAAPPMLRGLHFAIVDEADSILIDEARTPLILAEKAGTIEYAHAYPVALQVAAAMNEVEHYEIDRARREVRLTAGGREALAARCPALGSPWGAAHVREHLAVQALRARELFHRDQHYLIDGEGLVQIIDEYTGRVLPGRTWEGGLHQMIECKEGLTLSEQTLTLARITYQRFFARYLRLAGMTGTAREVAAELAVVYRLQTVAVPTHRSDIRTDLPPRLCADEASKWEAVADFVRERQQAGQPVLIGTRSVEASDRLSHVLSARGLAHVVLNARQDADEAAVVAAAGQPGAITVATNMAGRGTDIALGEGVAERGGLCVVLTEYHESPRIDRQLVGRCARQGDPGAAVAIVAVDDALLREHGGPEAAVLRRLHAASPTVASGAALSSARAAAQGRAERMHARTRRDTLRHDRNLDQMMSISGDPI
jgi:preprotein translocase subunit SecA